MMESLTVGAPSSKPRAAPLPRLTRVEPRPTAAESNRFSVAPGATLSAETPLSAKPAPRTPWETVATPPPRFTEPATSTRPRPVLVRFAVPAETATGPVRVRAAKRSATLKVAPLAPTETACEAVALTGTAREPTPA